MRDQDPGTPAPSEFEYPEGDEREVLPDGSVDEPPFG